MITEAYYHQYFNALLSGDRITCAEKVERLLDKNIPIYTLYTDLFQRSMYEVGSLWEENKISVAVEHLTTSITESLLALVYPKLFSAAHKNRSIVVSCSANEYHQIGAKMVADVFELNGWHGYFLGANTPINDLITYIDHKKPDIVGLSLSIYFNLPLLSKIIDNININFPHQDILVGGQAFRWGGKEELNEKKNVLYLESLEKIAQVAE